MGTSRTGSAEDIALAHQMAGVADAISWAWFHQQPTVHTKPDGTAVSQADLAVDHALVDLLSRERPTDDVLSEESGTTTSAEPAHQGPVRRWILDPIDGTHPFLAGHRAWGTHIALEVDGDLKLAVLTRPTEQRRWWAVRGHGAWSSPTSACSSTDQPLTVSTTTELGDARIGGFTGTHSGLADAARRHAHWREDWLGPIVGLLEGRLDVVLAPGGASWDHAPQVLLTLEAGGRYTDRAGGQRFDAGGGLYTNSRLDHALAQLPSSGKLTGRTSAPAGPALRNHQVRDAPPPSLSL